MSTASWPNTCARKWRRQYSARPAKSAERRSSPAARNNAECVAPSRPPGARRRRRHPARARWRRSRASSRSTRACATAARPGRPRHARGLLTQPRTSEVSGTAAALAMLVTAVEPLACQQRFLARQMQPARGAAHHRLRQGTWRRRAQPGHGAQRAAAIATPRRRRRRAVRRRGSDPSHPSQQNFQHKAAADIGQHQHRKTDQRPPQGRASAPAEERRPISRPPKTAQAAIVNTVL